MINSSKIAKMLMKVMPAYPKRDKISLQEIFDQVEYLSAASEVQKQIRINSAAFRYEYEARHSFLSNCFPAEYLDKLHNQVILDLGCFTGGRLVFWKEYYRLKAVYGIDVIQSMSRQDESLRKANKSKTHFSLQVMEKICHLKIISLTRSFLPMFLNMFVISNKFFQSVLEF